jgi:outer membrane receptor for ferrienterochelin and colicins
MQSRLPFKKNKTLGLMLLASLQAATLMNVPMASADDDDIEEVLVISSRTKATLDDSPMRVQVLNEEELYEKANMKPGDIRMVLNESTGIQVQQTSPTSFNSSIRIQGLDGRYTQLLRDGLPIYSGFSGSLGLLQIAPLDLQQVEVIKGASSTLYGGGAIAGLVNLISKRPGDTPETSLMLNGTSARGLDVSGFHSRQSGAHGFTLFGSYNRGDAYDPADNGLTAIPEFERVTVTPQWFYTVSDDTDLDVGIGFIDESRLGGSVDYVEGRAPDEYFESNDTRRMYSRLNLNHSLESGLQLTLKSAYSVFDRSLEIPDFIFSGKQTSTFNELTLANDEGEGRWVLGLNAVTEKFDQDQAQVGFNHDYSEETVGAFGQYTRELSSLVVLEGGLRADSHSDYGSFILPRVSVLLLPMDDLTMRIGGGYGYKTPNLFITEAEEIHFRNLEPIDPALFEGETSKGVNFDINHRLEISEELSLSTNFLVFYTQIDDALEIIESDEIYRFHQLDTAVKTDGAELNLTLSFSELRYLFGYTYVDARKETASGDVDLPLVSQHRVNQVVMWEREDDFRVGFEAYYFSEQNRENDTPGRSYWTFGLMMEKTLSEQVTAFLNFENFTDSRQTRYENIYTGNLTDPVFRDIYAPLDGRVINGGVRVRF